MKFVNTFIPILLLTAALAGCTDADMSGEDIEGRANPIRKVVEPVTTAVNQLTDVAFAPVNIIDADHAGGEPVIVVHTSGAYVISAHPGYTHVRGPDTDLVTGTTGQAFVWRSEDKGATWEFIGIPVAGAEAGPRNAATSVSDPDFAMTPSGRIILTTLQSLVSIPVEISDDGGKTWSGQPLHGPPGVDRNWVAACDDDHIYQVYTHLPIGRWWAHSSDGGQTWLDQHSTSVSGNIACDQYTEGGKYLYAGSGSTLQVSTDHGVTWTRANQSALGDMRSGGGMARPAIDKSGNVYTVGIANGTTENMTLYYTVSQDHGQSFSRMVTIPTAGVVNGTAMWPWIAAQDEGHIGITFYAASKYGGATSFDRSVAWDVFSVIVPNALDAEPTAYLNKASNVPVHYGAVCIGTVCQANPQDSGDRRMGDFFTATFDLDGAFVIATGATQVPQTGQVDGGGLAHPAIIKQIAGPSGLAGMTLGASTT